MRVWVWVWVRVRVRARVRVHLVAEGDAVVLDGRVARALVFRCGCGGGLFLRGLGADRRRHAELGALRRQAAPGAYRLAWLGLGLGQGLGLGLGLGLGFGLGSGLVGGGSGSTRA